jgi:hypothetical protein
MDTKSAESVMEKGLPDDKRSNPKQCVDKEDESTKIIAKLLPKISDEQSFDQVLDMVKLIDPDFSFLAKITGPLNIAFQSKFINILPQPDFNRVLNKYNATLHIDVLKLLSNEKLESWYSVGPLDGLYYSEIRVFEILVEKNAITTTQGRKHMIDAYIRGKLGKNDSTPEHYNFLKLLLMTYGNEVEIDATIATNPKILHIIVEYLQNKNKMLQLECDTKESCIKDLENK